MRVEPDDALCQKIYLVVEQIPAGKVATYGDIAEIVGDGCDGRMVGYALGMLKEQASQVPWQRVINREGGVSTRGLEQRHMLENEGVSFDERERVPLSRFRWAGPSPEWAAAHECQTLPPRPEEDAEQLRMF